MSGFILKLTIATAAGFFLGKYFYSTYKNRRLYYAGLIDFITALGNNLSFRQEKLTTIVAESASKTNAVFKEQMTNFCLYINGKEKFDITCKSVKNDAVAIENFFKNIGTVDLLTQKEALTSYKNEFAEKLKKSESDEKSKGTAYLKLCTLAGLAIGIFLL